MEPDPGPGDGAGAGGAGERHRARSRTAAARLHREADRRHGAPHAARPLGIAEDVAQAGVFLAQAPYITGVVLPVDGGERLGMYQK